MGGEEPEARRRAAELVVELGRKMAEFGPAALRVVTVEEAERERLDWFRLGWEEHARLVSGESAPAAPSGPRLRVADNGDAPDRASADAGVDVDVDVDVDADECEREHDRADDFPRSDDRGGRADGERADGEEGAGHGSQNGSRDEFPLPVVGAAEAEVRELMPHRLRSRGRHRP
ncbi:MULTISPECIES: hypothetical protein [unclassified Streptomyces]|uniref:hypothetical protein n=1 Tax=unclassified Streptomyces TaxID=2593676 RepID=UPI00278C001F|nr:MULTISPECIES: hypothetical protein [unclassified Streptomyces]